jgi:hypothetical protein
MFIQRYGSTAGERKRTSTLSSEKCAQPSKTPAFYPAHRFVAQAYYLGNCDEVLRLAAEYVEIQNHAP